MYDFVCETYYFLQNSGNHEPRGWVGRGEVYSEALQFVKSVFWTSLVPLVRTGYSNQLGPYHTLTPEFTGSEISLLTPNGILYSSLGNYKLYRPVLSNCLFHKTIK